jgi:transposase
MYTYTINDLVAFHKRSSDPGQKFRLKAIISIKKGNKVGQVSKDFLVSRKSLSSWQKRLQEKGVDGLATNKGGRKEGNPKWDAEIWKGLGRHIKETNGYWSIPKMIEWIFEKYCEHIPEQTVWYHLNLLGFSYKSARPHPYLGNREKQDMFKKTVSNKTWRR